MSFLDELNGLMPADPATSLFEDLTEEELQAQQGKLLHTDAVLPH